MTADVVDAATRSRMMSGIRGRDTKPEMVIRRGLHARGYRYRLHSRRLPGRPDLVFTSRKAVIFVHGCFWHGHGCPLFKWPATRAEWWREKIEANRARDASVREQIAGVGWRQLRVWECALKGARRRDAEAVLDEVAAWLEGDRADHEMQGE